MVIIHDIMKKGKEKWDKPVSKKYYEGIIAKTKRALF